MVVTERRGDTIVPAPPEDFLSPFFFRGFIHIVAGGEGAGKTTLLTHLAARMSHGVNGLTEQPLKSGPRPTLFYSLETPGDSLMLHYLASGGRPKHLVVAEEGVLNENTQDAVEAQWARIQPGLVVIDTLAKFYETDRSKKVIDHNQRFLESLARKHRCAVVLLHHPTKDGKNWYGGSGAIATGTRYGYSLIPGMHLDGKIDRSKCFLLPEKFNHPLQGWPDAIKFARVPGAKVGRYDATMRLQLQSGSSILSELDALVKSIREKEKHSCPKCKSKLTCAECS